MLTTAQVAVWDGHFPLQVLLTVSPELQVVEVAAEPLINKEYSAYVRTAPEKLDLHPKPVAWVKNRPFTVDVPSSGRTSRFGRELSNFQFQLLVLRITYQNGKVEFIPIEIPDRSQSRQVTVSIPEHPSDS